jgi:ADP-dependent phosphofructokinase/glucokinase
MAADTLEAVTIDMGQDVVLGLGGGLDYEIAWDPSVLEELVTRYAIRSSELSTSVEVASERDLVRSMLAFVRDGVGGERYVASSDIVEAFAARFQRRVVLGGTCLRAALAMSRLGVRSSLHLVSINNHVRRALPDQVSYICSASQDTTHPHLIVQFPAGARVHTGDVDLRAPHANRLIYVNDPPSRELVLSTELGTLLSTAAIFLVSGFNSMQNRATLDRRLHELREHMQALPSDALVVYEDAGFHAPDLSRQVLERLVDVVDVHSMNEDEMQAYVCRPLDLLDVASTATALREVTTLVPVHTLVVHTKCWSLAFGPLAESYRSALQTGTGMAGARYLHGDDFTETDYQQTSRYPERPAGRAFAEAIEALLPDEVCCVPAFDLSSATPTTIGLGDTFVGGFVAALADAPRSDRRGAA